MKNIKISCDFCSIITFINNQTNINYMRVLFLALIVFISGCVQTNPTVFQQGELMVSLDVSSDTVFQGEETTLYIDIENKMVLTRL